MSESHDKTRIIHQTAWLAQRASHTGNHVAAESLSFDKQHLLDIGYDESEIHLISIRLDSATEAPKPLDGEACERIYDEACRDAVAEKSGEENSHYHLTALVHVYAAGQRSVASATRVVTDAEKYYPIARPVREHLGTILDAENRQICKAPPVYGEQIVAALNALTPEEKATP